MDEHSQEWIIQRCLNAFRDEYEDWSGYCERQITSEEMTVALAQCNELWPDYEFRGHRVVNPLRKRPTLQLVR